MPSGQTARQKFTMNFPVALNCAAVDMERRESAPAPSHAPIVPPLSAPPYGHPHGAPLGRSLGFPQANPYPDADYSNLNNGAFPSPYDGPTGSFRLASSATIFEANHVHDEPETMSPESTASTLPPTTPDRNTHTTAQEIDQAVKSETLDAAIEDIKTAKQIFSGWYNQLFAEL